MFFLLFFLLFLIFGFSFWFYYRWLFDVIECLIRSMSLNIDLFFCRFTAREKPNTILFRKKAKRKKNIKNLKLKRYLSVLRKNLRLTKLNRQQSNMNEIGSATWSQFNKSLVNVSYYNRWLIVVWQAQC